MKVLIIDAGHGGSDPGASKFGYLEKELTLIMAKRVRELLKEYSPDMTRTTDVAIDPTPRANLVKSKYQYCLSIHLNAGGGSGIETIHSKGSVKGKLLAENIANSLKSSIGLPIRRVFDRVKEDGKDYYYMHRQTGTTITVIVECLFLDSENDIKHLNTENIALGIAEGFKEFMKSEDVKEVIEINRLLRKGVKGEDVKELQKKLTEVGFYIGTIDGSFGPATDKAVKAFQSSKGLVADGIVGPATFNMLDNVKKN